MRLSKRVKSLTDSITMKLNEKAGQLSDEGRVIYNLSSGQLPIKPLPEFVEKIQQQLNFLKSYQYSPSGGFKVLRDKMLDFTFESRGLNKDQIENSFSCILSNGSKHTLYNIFGALLNSDDEVILLAPYWVSYPEMIKFWGGKPVVVSSNVFNGFVPAIEDIKKLIGPKTKAIIVNSPNNPAGIHYSEEWMKEFGSMMKDYPEIFIISDEVYSEITYFDPRPTFFYQSHPELLPQTIIVNAISKMLAATGLRLGYAVAREDVIEAMIKIQGQTTSGPNSLIQRALIDFDLRYLESFLIPVKNHIRQNASNLREKFRESNLGNCWYQSSSAFYFMIDFSRTPMFAKLDSASDHSFQIADDLLERFGILVVPGFDFGVMNTCRISLLIEEIPFQEALNKLVHYLNKA